jgi:putative toxin-antitoxin system antitoxin component (TIGR02293 family)
MSAAPQDAAKPKLKARPHRAGLTAAKRLAEKKAGIAEQRTEARKQWIRAQKTVKVTSALGDYSGLHRSAALERINMVRAGIAALDAKHLLAALAIPAPALDLSVSTLNRRAKASGVLQTDEGERILGLARLVGQVQTMVEESGDPVGFDAEEWTSQWLMEPVPALGGVKPIDLLDTMEGQTLVADALARLQSGAYA